MSVRLRHANASELFCQRQRLLMRFVRLSIVPLLTLNDALQIERAPNGANWLSPGWLKTPDERERDCCDCGNAPFDLPIRAAVLRPS